MSQKSPSIPILRGLSRLLAWTSRCIPILAPSTTAHPTAFPMWSVTADAAGLPILPGLVRYDEAVERKAIEHALRFTVERSRRAYVAPATHFASPHTDENLPPMGMRVRLRSNFNMTGYPPDVQVILRA